jgi:uncharacterized protein YndB with AHSA1/START domain
MLTTIVIAVLAFVAGLLIVAARKPDIFEVSRSATIRATPERIFALLADFQEWGVWSPYEKKDPAMKRSFKGATSGVGAVYAFDGNKQVGTGELAIVEVQAPVKLAVTLDMTRPMACSNLITFTLAPSEGGTLVSWHMQGACPFMGKLMGTVFNMDRMVGGDFEKGLAALKQAAERPKLVAAAA